MCFSRYDFHFLEKHASLTKASDCAHSPVTSTVPQAWQSPVTTNDMPGPWPRPARDSVRRGGRSPGRDGSDFSTQF